MVMKNRYERNVSALSEKEVLELHTKRVCVVGCGGLGGYIVEILARIGVLNITIVDYDVFDVNNLNRQLFSAENLLGVSKVDAAASRIASINSDVIIRTVKEKLDDTNAANIIADHDIVVDALDNIQTRSTLSKACDNKNIPMVHGSIGGWFGQVACIFPGDGLIKKIYKDTGERGIEKKLGNLPFTASTVASIQCAECIKLLLGRQTMKNSLMQIDLLHGELNVIDLF